MITVIGSGPSAAACVTALVERGMHVTVIDVGLELEEDRVRQVDAYKKTSSASSLQVLKSGMVSTTEGVDLKLLFGSDFPYREASESLRIVDNSSALKPSFAFGGFSNVWGASILPFRDADTRDWPISEADLRPHYEAVAKIIGVASGPPATLEEYFPTYSEAPGQLDLSLQSQLFWKDLQNASSFLKSKGLLFGRGRLAVKAGSQKSNDGCNYSGLCLYGCPDGHIYNSQKTIRSFIADGRVTYQSNVIVKKIIENAHEIEIIGKHRITGEILKFSSSKVFLATGVIPTASIVLESLGQVERTLQIKDSQYFILPMLRFKGAPDVSKETTNTLSQIFIELIEGFELPKSSHLQIYGYNELFGQALKSKLGLMGRISPALIRFLQNRLFVAIGYLHSDLSGNIELSLSKNAEGNTELRLNAQENSLSKKHIREVVKKLAQVSCHTKTMPLLPMLQVGLPGRGYHSGCTFPMSKNPSNLDTDLLGRPAGYKNLHIVDASVLPSIPATTITFSVMANAHRIASSVEL